MKKKIEDLLVEFEKHWSWMYSKHIAVDELVKEVESLVSSAVEEERERLIKELSLLPAWTNLKELIEAIRDKDNQ